MPSLLLGRNNRMLGPPSSLAARIRCWLKGGHAFYYNRELGGLWCFDCQGVWECNPPVDNR